MSPKAAPVGTEDRSDQEVFGDEEAVGQPEESGVAGAKRTPRGTPPFFGMHVLSSDRNCVYSMRQVQEIQEQVHSRNW